MKKRAVVALGGNALIKKDQDGNIYDQFENTREATKSIVNMVKDGSYLCAFRLMPLEEQFKKSIDARWSFNIIDMNRRVVAFNDESHGTITRWKWDFGDGFISSEQNPVHTYEKPGIYYVVTLEVEGPAGISRHTRYWEVMLK